MCGICGAPVDRSVAEYDHFPLPHAAGGETVVENARLVHATCHPRGPLRDVVSPEET
ncbi:MAG: HNH endonuclease [Candidatus Acidiferrales bacterium]